MAAVPNLDGGANRMLTDDKPFHLQGPLTVLRTQGHEAMLDGRRRSNIWMKGDGWHQVLVVDV